MNPGTTQLVTLAHWRLVDIVGATVWYVCDKVHVETFEHCVLDVAVAPPVWYVTPTTHEVTPVHSTFEVSVAACDK